MAACRAGPAPSIGGSVNPESAAQLLDRHEDDRVLRRLKPRPVEPAYRLGPGEGIALLVDVETTGLDLPQADEPKSACRDRPFEASLH